MPDRVTTIIIARIHYILPWSRFSCHPFQLYAHCLVIEPLDTYCIREHSNMACRNLQAAE